MPKGDDDGRGPGERGCTGIPPPGIVIRMEASAASVGYLEDREAILKRLARIEGQVRGLSRMVEQEAYCIDVLTQLGAVSKALDGVGLQVLSDHTDHCVRAAIEEGGAEAEEKVNELLEAVERFARTR
jgi:CsoR family transcriptional regulator, copper-sensing transcriptional repressor